MSLSARLLSQKINMASSSKLYITWSFKRDVLLARKVLIARPYKYKKGGKESRNIWLGIATALNEKREVRVQ